MTEINQSLWQDLKAGDNSKSVFAMVVEAGSVSAYEGDAAFFGDNVKNKFPSANYDIGESRKCYALGRSTASVFHTVRALEAGIKAIYLCLDLNWPSNPSKRNWHNSLTDIDAQIKSKWPTNATRSSGDGRLFEGIHARLAAMKNPYRNSTSHLDKVYTLEEADELITISKCIMRDIANRMNETGLPLAYP